MPQPTIYAGTFIHTPTHTALEILENHLIYVDGDGKIARINPVHLPLPPPPGFDNAPTVASGANEFFFPGLIDTHIHAPQHENSGIYCESLLDWLTAHTYRVEAALSDINKARVAYRHVVDLVLSHGTTTACYFATIHVAATNLLATICADAGQRAFIGRVCMDQNSPPQFDYCDASAADAVEKTKAVVKHCTSIDPLQELIAPIVTPRFAPTCSAELLRAVGDYASDASLRVQTHVDESKEEIEWVADLHRGSTSYTQVYDKAGLLTPRTVLAHAVHITDAELDLVKERNSGLSHCPVSNMALTSGNATVKRWLRKGIKVGLGTDLSGGFSPNLLETVRQAVLVGNMVSLQTGNKYDKLTVAETLYLATCGGAEVLGIQGKVGCFKEGMEWDAILVGLGTVGIVPIPVEQGQKKEAVVMMTDSEDTHEADLGIVKGSMRQRMKNDNPVHIYGSESWEHKVHKWVYSGDNRNTQKVWVKGRCVYPQES